MRTEAWSTGAKSLTLTVNGEAVEENVLALRLEDDINGAEDPKIGSTCAARLNLTIKQPTRTYGGKTITAAVGGVPLGMFKVISAPTKDDRAVIEAVDAMATAFEFDYTLSAATSTALSVIPRYSGGKESGSWWSRAVP